MENEFFAIKYATVFGTYTLATFEKKEDAEEYRELMKAARKGTYYIQKVGGVFNGNLKLA
jgi:hypothetical protein